MKLKRIISMICCAITTLGVCLFASCGTKKETATTLIVALAEETTAQNESTVTITATVAPAEAASTTKLDWSIAWADPSSTWASGKTVSDYVTITPTSDGALTANVECLQAFGEQIVVNASVREDADVYATCTVDYASKITSTTPTFTCALGTTHTLTGSTVYGELTTGTLKQFSSLTCESVFSTATVDDTFTYKAEIMFSPAFYSALGTAGVPATQTTAMEFYEFTNVRFLIGDWGLNVYGTAQAASNIASDATKYNKYITALTNMNGEPIGAIRITATGTYSTYTKTYGIVYRVEDLATVAEALTLSESAIVI